MAVMMSKTRSVLMFAGKTLNEALSFVVFLFLDIIDFLLCFVYKAVDFLSEAERKSCYCFSDKKPITETDKIFVSQKGGEPKIVSLTSSRIQLDEISDTLYSRPSLVTKLSNVSANELMQRMKNQRDMADQTKKKIKNGAAGVASRFTVSSTIVETLQGKIGTLNLNPVSRWSDCDCGFCTSWASSKSLHVVVQGPKGNKAKEDVLFIHGFISSSAFWTETVFPNFSSLTNTTYRMFAVDLLGFGRSPKPADSLYTLREHLEMIESSVIQQHKVTSFHVVAHSLGCILALALAVRHPGSIKSLTLLAPPYYPVPRGEQATQYVMRKVAPRRIWPPMAFGASMACWYEHVSRTICLLICKHHRLWEFLAKLITRNRIKTYLIEGFMCHTHNAAWHTLHNIICGTGSKLDPYLDILQDKLRCDVSIFHGREDQVIPVECSYDVQRRVPRAHVKVIDNEDHITIVVRRQKAFARELEEIWKAASLKETF